MILFNHHFYPFPATPNGLIRVKIDATGKCAGLFSDIPYDRKVKREICE